MRRAGLLGLFVLAMLPGCFNRDRELNDPNATYKLVYRPKMKGDRFEVTEKNVRKVTSQTVGLAPLGIEDHDKTESAKSDFAYTEVIKEFPDYELHPTESRRTYYRLRLYDAKDKLIDTELEGKTIWVERKKQVYRYTFEGGAQIFAVPIGDWEFGDQFADPTTPKFQDMLPKEPLKFNDTWKLEKSVLKTFAGSIRYRVDFAKSQASGRLVRAFVKNGATWAELDFRFEIVLDRVHAEYQRTPNGKINYVRTQIMPIDGSSHEGQEILVTEAELTLLDGSAYKRIDERREQTVTMLK